MITILPEPQIDICQFCGRLTELKSYTPRTPVCMACALQDKGKGSMRVDNFSVRFRPFEPS